MKGAFAAAVVAAAVGGAHANYRHHQAHALFHAKRDEAQICTPGCTTIYTTMTGAPTCTCCGL